MRKKKQTSLHHSWDRETMFGANMSFAAMESYKLLRTNIMFSFAGTGCRVIGVTSTVSGEGKSLTACNLAYCLAEAGKKVLLLDGDLRLPTIAAKLGLAVEPGVSNLLVSREDYGTVLQRCPDVPGLDVITAGSPAPNPSELLGSERMGELMQSLSAAYEYIIVDLPPVTVVSDALVISKLLGGVIMVVRNGVVEEQALADALRQLKLVELRVLGFVYNGGTGKRRRYDKYYHYYDETKRKKS